MSASCREIRDRLETAEAGSRSRDVETHLDRCAACARFASRLDAVRDALAGHQADVRPDPGFATRVAARLRHDPADVLGWAAVRLLPATLVLLAALAWIAFSTTSTPGDLLAEGPTDDLLTWVVQTGNGGAP
jgi:anti-sigma factor RsiW